MSKTMRAWVGACALVLLPGILFAEPDRRHTRYSDRTTTVERHLDRERGSHHHHRADLNRGCGCVVEVVPGYYRTVVERIQTPGHYERVWVPAPTIRFGRHLEVGFSAGCHERVWVAGETRRIERRVWVPAERVIRKHCRRHRR